MRQILQHFLSLPGILFPRMFLYSLQFRFRCTFLCFLLCFIEQIDLPIEYDFGFLGFAAKQILTQKCILFLQALDLR